MHASPPNSFSQSQDDRNQRNPNRLCDFCGESTALLHCRADSAQLCLSCDRHVHSTNQLFTKHTRWQLCDLCDSSPALIFCVTDRKVLCQNCDFESHKSLRNPLVVHDHRALEGFDGWPNVSQLSNFLGLEDFDPKSLVLEKEGKGGYDGLGGLGGGLFSGSQEDNGVSDFLVWDTPGVISIDDLISSTADKVHNFQALDVPPLPKGQNGARGKYKEEIVFQLCQLALTEDNKYLEAELLAINQFLVDGLDSPVQDIHDVCSHGAEAVGLVGLEESSYTWFGDDSDAANDFLLSSSLFSAYVEEISSIDGNACTEQNSSVTETSELTPKSTTQDFSNVDRVFALSRYKEKKRTRRYDKNIRYESRKVLAEGRTRIKGRFAKVDRTVIKLRR